ncbi:MAG TPA: prepilin-type N-terminal cleavage/methylation domain-containing protein [Stellaceae bacterium]|nr:prepilin-type N-terminal cleavage/methylation domain-containing protein [Stellaceae bacterium]
MTARAHAGFTLVELLVAMALLALLSALLVGGLRLSRGAVMGSEAASEKLLRTELALTVIRRQLERADPLPLGGVNPPQVAFAGDAAGAVFIAPPGAYLALGGEEVTWLAIERGKSGVRIVLRFRPLDRAHDLWPPTLDPAAMQTVVLVDDAASAALAYFGRDRPDADPQWQQEWHDRTSLPALIRLAIAGGAQAWPDLIVTPRLGRPVDTGLLPGGPLCRRGGAFQC